MRRQFLTIAFVICGAIHGADHAIAQTTADHGVTELTAEDVGPFRPQQQPELKRVEQMIMQQTNQFRKKRDREILETEKRLQQTARDFAAYMARTDRYGHQADARSSAERARAHDYPLCLIAENIAYFFATEGFETEELARQAVDGWIDSPPHRENMLRKHVTETGVGVAQSEQTGVFYAVQLFGRPTSQAIRFQLKNDSGQSITYQLGNHSYSLPPSYTRTHQMCVPYGLTLQTAESKQNSRQLKNGEELIVTMGKDGLRIESRANQE